MPRGPQLDAPGTFHYVMVWRIGRRGIFEKKGIEKAIWID